MIKLFTTGCPRCKILEKKLQQANLEFETIINFDINAMIQEGFNSAPILEVNGIKMDYVQAIKWLNERSK